MKWRVELEGKLRQRIRVFFDPIECNVHITGSYKIPKEESWIVFVTKITSVENAMLNMSDILYDVYGEMKEKINKYNEFSTFMLNIKKIEIVGEADEITVETESDFPV